MAPPTSRQLLAAAAECDRSLATLRTFQTVLSAAAALTATLAVLWSCAPDQDPGRTLEVVVSLVLTFLLFVAKRCLRGQVQVELRRRHDLLAWRDQILGRRRAAGPGGRGEPRRDDEAGPDEFRS